MPLAPNLEMVPAGPADVDALAECFFASFCRSPQPQAGYFAKLFPEAPGTRRWFTTSFAAQMAGDDGGSSQAALWLKVVDRTTGAMAGFVKWTPPGAPESEWTAYGEEQDAALCDHLFHAMDVNRAKLTGGRPHWYLEILGVSEEFHKCGIGSELVRAGVERADADGVEAYVDASPAGRGLYAKYGFVEGNRERAAPPFEFYEEVFMVRPAPAKA